MQLEIFVLLVVLAFAFISLGYAINITLFSTFGFAILFFLGTILMGLNSADGILINNGQNISYVYDNYTLLSSIETNLVEPFSHFFFGLIMSFVSVIGIVLILLHTRSGGLNDE